MLKRTHRRRSVGDLNCKGIAFIELAIVLPLILLLIIGTVDVGRALIAYLELTRVVYEGARLAGVVTGLESGQSVYTNPCPPASPVATNHCLIHQRVNFLFQNAYQLNKFLHNERIETSYVPITTDPVNQGFVTVTVRADFQSMFSFLTIPIRSTMTGPYLASGTVGGGA